MAAGAVLPLGVAVPWAVGVPEAAAAPPTPGRPGASRVCTAPAPGAPMLITEDCDDPRYNRPFIDVDTWRDTPTRHRFVSGGFTGTAARFAFYLPPPRQYRGRFFQITYPLFTSEEADADDVGFALAHGAYHVRTNMGGAEEGIMSGGTDPSVWGYRINAAAAKFSRVVAAGMYGRHRAYGYLHGASGGAYQTVSALENTVGVWDGGVPCVMGSPNAIPSMFTVRVHALRVLRRRGKLAGILDAVDPGGSGDPYAGLDAEERGALREATRLGFPLPGWWDHATMDTGALPLVAGNVRGLDPTYAADFWSKPGYLGTDPSSSVAAARVRYEATVVDVLPGASRRLVLTGVPTGDAAGADLVVTSGAASGSELPLGTVEGTTVGFGIGADPEAVARIAPGDRVRIDNSWFLALQTYHRHQVPTPDMYGWNQFRGPDGRPLYPQRDVLVGPTQAFNAGGGRQTGRFHGKMIVLESLVDIDAMPWQADWYRGKARQAFGHRLDDGFRLWFTDNAQHNSTVRAGGEARIVPYLRVLQQALLDLSAWVEKGKPPPAGTNYDVADAQVKVPRTAARRKGIQPVVTLTANGRERADVAVGEQVAFTAEVQTPPGAGEIVAAEWDFEGVGTYPTAAGIDRIRPTATVRATYAYSQPGTYFPVIRATAQREGDARTPYTRVQNLARVRVVVT
ncbi:Tat pathway signal sequence domain protein [Yinghuangia sp. ASG 101]|uniref:PKD domain-containing protein n=1 Tax=Yinghuangia sp. ASG 101 TaxID=2896848 RepID=UPI001E31BF11|nr:Tat pathway signal sequence domain protein [Yinghuangia sp. ASG 101]UGQ11507.1 Tat pathway signal sequence domain protein [Yinghuangia sp. ASG 101]